MVQQNKAAAISEKSGKRVGPTQVRGMQVARDEFTAFINAKQYELGAELVQAARALIGACPDNVLCELTDKNEKELIQRAFKDTQAYLATILSPEFSLEEIFIENGKYIDLVKNCHRKKLKKENITVAGEIAKAILKIANVVTNSVISSILLRACVISPAVNSLPDTLTFSSLRSGDKNIAAELKAHMQAIQTASHSYKTNLVGMFKKKATNTASSMPREERKKERRNSEFDPLRACVLTPAQRTAHENRELASPYEPRFSIPPDEYDPSDVGRFFNG
ncbi:MAG TPA: hypothetical protein VNC84_08320 [Gammaproteobacteria bacterium]|jgi:hypothetical protein|nr:hypothetical protein [Gammaproteobacteria bacterium]